MPKPTFYKLPEAKRRQFMTEAYKEFSHNSFEAASITNLVKSLGIAKGSVYQYFTDKEELYSFLVHDANKQLNQLLDKACDYKGEDFIEWYTKLLLVKVKFFLSFPQFAVLFQKLMVESANPQRSLAKEIEENWLTRISASLPASMYGSDINSKLLVRSPLLAFELITSKLNLNKLIEDENPVLLESGKLVALCSEWVKKLEQGL
jgi:AcrR family transcriptional regulator